MSNAQERMKCALAPTDALQRVLGGLGDDVIVREEEDGFGRFAGVRPIALIGRRQDELQLFRGTWGELKKRAEEPMLTVSFQAEGAGSEVTLEGPADDKLGMGAKVAAFVGDVVSIAVLIAALAYGFNRFRGFELDYGRLTLISLGGAFLYAVAKQFFGEAEEELSPLGWLRARVKESLNEPGSNTESDGASEPSSATTPS